MDAVDPIELYVSKEVLERFQSALDQLHHAIVNRRNFDRHSAVNEQLFTALMWATTAQHWLQMARQQAAAEHTGSAPPIGVYRTLL